MSTEFRIQFIQIRDFSGHCTGDDNTDEVSKKCKVFTGIKGNSANNIVIVTAVSQQVNVYLKQNRLCEMQNAVLLKTLHIF
jgi:hypothetical protein